MTPKRSYIPYSPNVRIGPNLPNRGLRFCINCNIQLLPTTCGQVCDVCWSMLSALNVTSFFRNAHKEWSRENDLRVANKHRLLAGNDSSREDDYDPDHA